MEADKALPVIISATGPIRRRTDLTPAAKLVYLHLASRLGDNDCAWPSVATLSVAEGLNRATVFRALKLLEDKGLLQRDGSIEGTNVVRWRVLGLAATGTLPPSQNATPPVAECDTPRRKMSSAPSQNATDPVAKCDTEPFMEPSNEPNRRGSFEQSYRTAYGKANVTPYAVTTLDRLALSAFIVQQPAVEVEEFERVLAAVFKLGRYGGKEVYRLKTFCEHWCLMKSKTSNPREDKIEAEAKHLYQHYLDELDKEIADAERRRPSANLRRLLTSLSARRSRLVEDGWQAHVNDIKSRRQR